MYKIYFSTDNKFLRNEIVVYTCGEVSAYLLAIAERIRQGKEYQSAERMEMYRGTDDDLPSYTVEINKKFKKQILKAL